MKKALLTYEPALQGYSLKFDYDVTLLSFLKKTIPAHKRTSSGPPDWVWYFGSEFYEVVKLLFESYRDKYKHIVYDLKIVSEDEVRKLQAEQAQREQDTSQYVFTTQQYSIDERLRTFYELLPHNGTSFDTIRNLSLGEATKWYKRAALVYHPDRNQSSLSAAEQMSRLNEVWSLLKEVYYTK